MNRYRSETFAPITVQEGPVLLGLSGGAAPGSRKAALLAEAQASRSAADLETVKPVVGERQAARQAVRRNEQRMRRRRFRIRSSVSAVALVGISLAALNGAVAEAKTLSGALTLQPGSAKTIASGLEIQNGGATGTFTFPGSSVGASVYFGLQVRAGGTGSYVAKTRVQPDGKVSIGISRVATGSETFLGTVAVPGLSVTSATQLDMGIAVTGGSPVKIAARVWRPGTTVPAWQVAASDNSATKITTRGAVRPWAYLSSGAAQGTVIVYTGLAVQDTDVSTVVVTPTPPTSTSTPKPTASATSSPKPTASATTAPKPTASATTSKPAATATTAKPAPAAGGGSGSGSGGSTSSAIGVKTTSGLKVVKGNLVITKAGATYDGYEIKGNVDVKAANVTIKNSIIRGGAATGNRGVVKATDPAVRNLVISDSTIKPTTPNVLLDGIIGHDFTLKNVDVDGGVDAVKVLGDNVSITGSWLHGLDYFASDRNQGGGPTHNDGIQMQGGTNVTIAGNKIEGTRNAAIMVTQDMKLSSNVKIQNNTLSGGACTVNIVQSGKPSVGPVVLAGNRFARDSTVANCAVATTAATKMTASSNVYADNNQAVKINVWN